MLLILDAPQKKGQDTQCNQAERKQCFKNVFTNDFHIVCYASREEADRERHVSIVRTFVIRSNSFV